MLSLLGIIGILVLAFVVLGLLGWGLKAFGSVVSFLGEGFAGCIGCFVRFFFFIFLAYIIISTL